MDLRDRRTAGPAPSAAAEVGDLNLHDLLIEVLERKASDLHLTAGAMPMIRLNGELGRWITTSRATRPSCSACCTPP